MKCHLVEYLSLISLFLFVICLIVVLAVAGSIYWLDIVPHQGKASRVTAGRKQYLCHFVIVQRQDLQVPERADLRGEVVNVVLTEIQEAQVDQALEGAPQSAQAGVAQVEQVQRRPAAQEAGHLLQAVPTQSDLRELGEQFQGGREGVEEVLGQIQHR